MRVLSELLNEILDSGVFTGFLLNFCSEHYCAENVEFLLSIKTFHHLFNTDSWEDWQHLDGLSQSDPNYLAAQAKFEELFDNAHSIQIEREVQRIWTSFLDPKNSAAEVCLSHDAMENTKSRMKFFKVYGPDVFAEATLEPTKALLRDILPRFLHSPQGKDMLLRRKQLQSLPPAHKLEVPPPPQLIPSRIPENIRCITDLTTTQTYVEDLNNYISDNILYERFLSYLQGTMASENLLCLRAIYIYNQCSASVGQTAMVQDVAWCIYLFFLSSGSVYEVSTPNSVAHRIAMQMHHPAESMFDDLVEPTKQALRTQFEQFKNSPQYEALIALVLCRRDAIVANSIETRSEKPFRGLWAEGNGTSLPVKAPIAVELMQYFCWGSFGESVILSDTSRQPT